MIEIANPNDIPKEGKVAVFVTFKTTPCQKFLNYSRQAIGILEGKNPLGGSYFNIQNTPEVKEALKINMMPTCIVYVDGVEKKRFTGHFWSQFEIANYISEGFSK